MLQKTPLYPQHLKAKARMVEFAGWLMPVQYEGILSEYKQCREKVAIFDTSHMGEFILEGEGAEKDLDRIVTQKIVDMNTKTCRYGMILNNRGGVLDDCIVYKISSLYWMVVVNASHIEEKAEHFMRNISSSTIFKDISQETGKIDIQGPLSREMLEEFIEGIGKLGYFAFDKFDVLSENIIISRTGYTGELGYEVYLPVRQTIDLWNKLCDLPQCRPAGLGARDVLRLEMGYSLYGQDLDSNISPLEAGMRSFVDFDKEFIGKNILLKEEEEGVKRKMVCFTAQGRRSPRSHYKIFTQDQQEIGEVTSGTFSPSLQRGIGMGLVCHGADLEDKSFYVGEGKSRINVHLTRRPFYKKGSLKN